MKIKKNFSTCGILLLLMLGCAFTTNSYASGLKGTIQGQVVDADNQQPLIGANVSLVGTQLGSATDDNGKFTPESVMLKRIIII